MKAIVYRENGPPDVLRYEEIDRPSPAVSEVLIRVRAASVNPLDWRIMRGAAFLRVLSLLQRSEFSRPGVDVAGVVEAVGPGVTRFRPGDEVFGKCRGAFAEYAVAPEGTLVVKPAAITFEQAASTPVAAITALQALRDYGHIQPGQKVLINGAAGGVGIFAVQIAKSFGAEVTGVCRTSNVEMVRSLGADRVIDYTQQDFTLTGDHYDVLLDNVGNRSLAACRRVLKPKGRCIIVGGPKQLSRMFAHIVGAVLLSCFVREKFRMMVAKVREDDLTTIADLMSSGKVTPVIDRRYTLSEVPDAFRYMEEGHARGKVIIAFPD